MGTASYAAGAMCGPEDGAHLLVAAQRRGLFTTDPHTIDIATGAGAFGAHHVAAYQTDSPAVTLSAALQRELLALELVTAANARAEVARHRADPDSDPDSDLVVIDGPVRSRDHLPRALGFIKTHRAVYLPPELNAVVGRLGTGSGPPCS